jgi:hypothetical protein
MLYLKKGSFCQDRLGTNIGKAQKRKQLRRQGARVRGNLILDRFAGAVRHGAREHHLHKTTPPLFPSTFPMFVPSLSWRQNDLVFKYKKARFFVPRRPCPAPRPSAAQLPRNLPPPRLLPLLLRLRRLAVTAAASQQSSLRLLQKTRRCLKFSYVCPERVLVNRSVLG